MASKINADEFVDREGEGKPTLPKGVVLSGVTTITTAVVAENEVANSTGINAGIITSTHFAGNLTGDVNAGIVTVTSQSVIGSAVTISASGIDIGAGVITATSYVGSGANLTGIGATIMVWEYNPDPGDMEVPFATGIGITFNQKIKAGSGNITLRETNASGTVVENFGIGSSVTISNNSLSLTPTSSLSEETIYYLELPSGVITNMAGDNYVGTAYTFQSLAYTRTLWGWGVNDYGELANNLAGAPTYRSSPVQVPGTTWRTTSYNSSTNRDDVIATKSDGTLWAWGRNNYGGLGQNSRQMFSSPVQVGSDTTWSSNVIGTTEGAAAVKTDGTLWVWGYNAYGRLGVNSEVNYSSPVQVGSDTDWSTTPKTLAGGQGGVHLYLKSNGTLWSMGNNNYGQLGLNEQGTGAASHSSPVQVPGTTWSRICASNWQSYAIKTDGTLWSWGYNRYGQLGLGSQGPGTGNVTGLKSSPTQIPGTDWSDIASSNYSGAAIRTDGTLFTWGRATNGRLGLNAPHNTDQSSPTQIPGTTWNSIDGSTSGYIATKTDGTLWGWGANDNGALGVNDTVNAYSSPVQVPGTDWGQEVYHIGTFGDGRTAIQQTT